MLLMLCLPCSYAMLLMLWDLFKMYQLGFGTYWASGWATYVSWINYALFIARCFPRPRPCRTSRAPVSADCRCSPAQIISLAMRILLDVNYAKIRNIKPGTAAAEVFPWMELALAEETITFLSSVNGLMTWLRVLTHLGASALRATCLPHECEHSFRVPLNW